MNKNYSSSQNALHQKAHKEAQQLSLVLNEDIFKNRKEIQGVTIDSPSSKDLDDALFAEERENEWIVHVSIADVSTLVKPESYIDQEAFKKAFTRYNKGWNDPMIPHVLSENALSLLENQKRPTLTFSIPVDKETFQLGDPLFEKTYVQSQKRFSYNEVDQILKRNQPHVLKDQLKTLSHIAKKRSAIQKGSGSHKDGSPSHTIVQECMLMANEAVAQYCDKNNIPILFRNQSNGEKKPNQVLFKKKQENKSLIQKLKEKLYKGWARLVLFCERNHIPLFTQKYAEKIRNLSFDDFHIEVKKAAEDPENFQTTVQQSVQNVIQGAEYGSESEGHSGLDMPAYTHATSPIRRYADLINHRIFSVIAEEGNDPKKAKSKIPYSKKELDNIAEQINTVTKKEKERRKKPSRKKPKRAA